jgi:hypothetical protein
VLSHLFVEEDICLVMQDIVLANGHNSVIVEAKPLPVGMLCVSSVVPPVRIPPMMSDGCNKLIISTLYTTKTNS